jgi:hypothetical protein
MKDSQILLLKKKSYLEQCRFIYILNLKNSLLLNFAICYNKLDITVNNLCIYLYYVEMDIQESSPFCTVNLKL